MPEITVVHISLLTVALLLGIVVGWVSRGGRSKNEKKTINAGWQEQLEAQRSEHVRLKDQNKSLMDQNSQYQASNKDSKMRATELSQALKEAIERRDELQRQVKDIRNNLESAVAQRDQLRNDIAGRDAEREATATALTKRDEKISRLNNELDGWQSRVPPLIESFRVRNEEAGQLEHELIAAHARISALEAMLGSDDTRVEPVDPDALTDGLDASNDPIDASGILDSIDASEFEEALPAEEPETLLPADPEANDDRRAKRHDNLKQIKGIGPAIEKTLNEMGIFRFDQIAAMSEYDINRVANKLRGFRSRIYREDWIGQARGLQDQLLDDQP